MNIVETIDNFNEIKIKIAKELKADIANLTEVTYFKYTESTYNGYVHASTIEEWLKWVIPLYMKE